MKLKTADWSAYQVIPLSSETRQHTHCPPETHMAANAPWEVGKSQAATSLGSIQTQGVSELAHLPPSGTGDPSLVCFSLILIVLRFPLKAAPVPCEGNRQRDGHRVRAVYLDALPLWSQCGLRGRISWRAGLLETNCTWQVLGHG